MPLKSRIKLFILSLGAGVLAGLAATAFLYLMDFATNYREGHLFLIWLLPLAGFLIGWVYFKYGRDIAGGNNLVLEEIHNPQKVLPARMAPFILISTVVTHLFGGSAGREGTVVQMGASLADQFHRFLKLTAQERRTLLMAGAGAGFGAAIGTPWAGMIFGMEVTKTGAHRWKAFVECALASFVATLTTHLLQAPHSIYPGLNLPSWDLKLFLWLTLASIAFGLTARVFIFMVHQIERLQKKWISYPPLKPAIGGILVVLLYYWEGSYRYVGLGIPVIQQALQQASSFLDPLYKSILTALTVGTGFKGGEFIPLVFIGASLGGALATLIPVSVSLLAGVGFAAVFAGAAHTPLACTVMAIEIFGWPIAPYAFAACFISHFLAGSQSIYRNLSLPLRDSRRQNFE